MTTLQRFMAAIQGNDVDRLPVSMWLHFASEHLPPEEVARLHMRYLEAYGWDYLKVMNDYRYPLPGIANVTSADDLRQFKPLSMQEPSFAKQLVCLRALRAGLGPDMPLIETLFNPLQTLVRGAGAGAASVAMDNPAAGHLALETVTQTLVEYVQALKGAGVTGLFYSINGAVEPSAGGLTDEQYAAFVAPYDLRILQAAEGLVRIAHVHGTSLRFERVWGYPVEAFSWSHFNSAPSMAEARRHTQAALVGGINEMAIARQSAAEIGADIERTVREAGPRKLLIGPGCTVPPDTPARLQLAAGRTAKGLRL
jgi:uroporphyrinogen decarboxylase